MKRFGDLFARIYDFENLWHAYRQARRGKRDRPEVQAFTADLEKNLQRIARALANQTWCPASYTTFTVYEGKPRLIAAAPFRDRVVHHAIVNVLEPLFDPTLVFDLYSNRKGKGTHAAVHRAQHFARRFPFVLHADVRQYFPSIDRDILLELIMRKVKCPETLALIGQVLDVHQPGLETGLPLGNQTSQFFANLYLSPVDHFIKESLRVPGYLRYVDDLWLFGRDKAELWDRKNAVARVLKAQFKLVFGTRATQVYPVEHGFPCLGFQVSAQSILVRRATVLRFRRRVKALQGRYARGKVELQAIRSSLMGSMGHLAQADTLHFRDKLLQQAVFSRKG